MRPPGPDPSMRLMSTPFSAASRFANGEALGASRLAGLTSASTIRPPGPDPVTVDRSTPSSRANLRVAGDDFILKFPSLTTGWSFTIGDDASGLGSIDASTTLIAVLRLTGRVLRSSGTSSSCSKMKPTTSPGSIISPT